jgi:hypothetical protein
LQAAAQLLGGDIFARRPALLELRALGFKPAHDVIDDLAHERAGLSDGVARIIDEVGLDLAPPLPCFVSGACTEV